MLIYGFFVVVRYVFALEKCFQSYL